jgi:hypothetical protein
MDLAVGQACIHQIGATIPHTDSRSRVNGRASGATRDGVAAWNRQPGSVQSASGHFACSASVKEAGCASRGKGLPSRAASGIRKLFAGRLGTNGVSAGEQGPRAAERRCRTGHDERTHANRFPGPDGGAEASVSGPARVSRLPLPRAIWPMPRPPSEERALRRLDLVSAARETVPASLDQGPGPADAPATVLAKASERCLEALQRSPDRRAAGCLYRRRRPAPEPQPPGAMGLPYWPAVLGPPGMQREGAGAGPECQNLHGTPANKGDFRINMGTAPGHLRNTTGTTPSAQGRFPCFREGERLREPNPPPASEHSRLPRTLPLPAETSLALPG